LVTQTVIKNWGVLWRADEEGNFAPKFAPAFDNGTSLAHEIMETRIDNFRTHEDVEKYINRCRHHMKWQRKDDRKCGHFESIEKVTNYKPSTLDPVRNLLGLDFAPVYSRIKGLTAVKVPVPLSEARADLICRMVAQRIQKFQKVLG